MISQTAVPYFAIGFATHLLLDLLNRKGEQLLYPLKNTYCLGVCSSSGVVNDILFAFGLVATIFLLYMSPTVQGLITKAMDMMHSMGV
jgi:inner membrane protein